MDAREHKALEIAENKRISFANGSWWVPSQSSAARHKVDPSETNPSCTCPDFELRQKPCKHVLALRLFLERQHGDTKASEPVIIPPRQPQPTYPQVWPAYNQAQQIEKERFRDLLFDLCADIPQPPPKPGKGKRPMIVRDAIFAAIYKIYTTFSARRFMTDLEEARERGYLSRSVSYNSIFKCLESEAATPILYGLLERSSLPLRSVETDFAVDSSGFCTSRFTRWFDVKYGVMRETADWVKVHIATGIKTNVITSAIILEKRTNDSPQFKPLLEATARNFRVVEVSGDKAYSSLTNLQAVVDEGGTPYVPFKGNAKEDRGGLWEKMLGYFQFKRDEFLAHYHKRSNVESTFSAVKRKMGDSVRSKTDVAMKNEVLGKLIAYNLCVVIQEMHELGIEADFWPDSPCLQEDERAYIVRFPG